MKMDNKRIVMLVKPFYKHTESETLIAAILRAQFYVSDERRAEIFARSKYVCVNCKRRKTEFCDHRFPLAWFRLAPRIGIEMDSDTNMQGLCVVCNNAKQRREEKMSIRMRRALATIQGEIFTANAVYDFVSGMGGGESMALTVKTFHIGAAKSVGKYLLTLCREFVANEKKESRRFNRWNAKRNEQGKKSRDTFQGAEKTVRLLFVAFQTPRNGPGNKDWRGKIANASARHITDSLARLTRLDIPETFRAEFANIWTCSQSSLTLFNVALESLYVLRRADTNETLAQCRAVLKLRAEFFAMLANKKIPLDDWQDKAKGETFAALDSLWTRFRDAKESVMNGTRYGEAV